MSISIPISLSYTINKYIGDKKWNPSWIKVNFDTFLDLIQLDNEKWIRF